MSKRLFVALDLPASVCEFLSELDPRVPKVRWLRSGQIHLTLSFLGNVEAADETALREKLALISFKKFFLPIAGLGTFPARGRPRVIWAGVGSGHPQLFLVYKRVQEAVLAAGLEPDLRAWHPHITLARCRDVSMHALRPLFKKHEDFDLGLVPADSFALYSSRPGPSGSDYTRELEIRAR